MVDMKSLLTMQGMMFLMILIGAGLRKIQIVTTEGRRSMTNLVVNLVLPCNILYAFSNADASAFRSMLVVVVMAFLIQLVWYLLSKVLWRDMQGNRRGVMRYAFQFSNCGYLGNPVIEGLYGAQGLVYASVFLLPVRLFMWSVGLECFQEEAGSFRKTIRRALTHPCVLATILGVVWMFFPIKLPDFLYNTISGFNQCLTPLTMLVIGFIMAETDLRKMFCKDLFVITALRLLIQPMLVLAVCRLLNLETLVAEVVTVLVSMPVANTTALLASQHDCDYTFASNVVVFTTLVSMITIPIYGLLVGVVFG
ncbi:MAG: AEC family transporter [Candidatus Merdisoma sp.]|jgi:predicted permease